MGDLIDEVTSFLGLISAASGSAPDPYTALSAALDRLALAYHAAPECAPSSDEEEPPADCVETRRSIQCKFPHLGLYPWIHPLDAVDGTLGMGDALDDLTDIVLDLRNVAWRWENTSPADATWYFKLSYSTHWGRHLANLRSYLHAVVFEPSTRG